MSSFDEALKVEKTRRNCWHVITEPFTWKYNKLGRKRKLPEYEADISIFATIFSWKGTIIPMVVTRPIFWIQLVLHLILAYIDFSDRFDLPELAWTTLTIPTSLVVFFIVFYAGQSYARFFGLYDNCIGIGGGIMCWVAMVKVTLTKDATIQWNCTRYLRNTIALELGRGRTNRCRAGRVATQPSQSSRPPFTRPCYACSPARSGMPAHGLLQPPPR